MGVEPTGDAVRRHPTILKTAPATGRNVLHSSQLAAARSKYSRALVFMVGLFFGRVPAHHDPRLAGRDQRWPIEIQRGDGCPASWSHADNVIAFPHPCEMFRPCF